ncbi:DUF4239 domain-containing protein [Pseudonocardia alaniniphila]|uniref:DUF4239 domain-containing protein n=1 Tax=Pseudonocardia alaniniphila TaxID=75291 RepID=A0ABS9TDU4_9PSEU|nr:DUF4239 domain-containing protein [Pseudonocardia alaniniphila]MCH6166704.1 DUF4239 domain-containing protein [Pseudonocardia alaniniphila]
MSRWIVSNVPSVLLLAALVVVVAAGTVAVLAYVRHRFPGLAQGGHNDVAKVGFSVVGPVYGFMIGFIVVVLWGQVNAADEVARTEGASAVQMARDLRYFEAADSDRIRQSLLEYERAAVAEWSRAASGHSAPEAESALARLYAAYESVQPRDDRQRAVLANSLASLDQLSLSRTERLVMAVTNAGPSWSLWLVIFLLSGLVLGFAVIYGETRARTHYAMVAAVSVLVAVNLFLVTELAHPFLGELGTSSEALREAINYLGPQ